MSNYRAGVAVCISQDAQLVAPKDEHWWKEYSSLITSRYDTPASEKEASCTGLLPLFLHLRGEVVFPWMDACEKGDPYLEASLPKEHGAHKETNRTLMYSMYGGDYWLDAICSCSFFWQGLHKAGTRGTFILEVGCEHSISFRDFSYELYGAAWPAWYLLVATLGDTCTLERVYPDPEDIKPHIQNRGEGCGSGLHFFWKYEGKMMDVAVSSSHRELID